MILDRWGRVGKGELGDYSCDMHRAFTSFPQARRGVTHPFASLIWGLDDFHCDVLVAGDAYTDVQDVNARYRKALTPIRWTSEFDREIYAMEFSVSGVTT